MPTLQALIALSVINKAIEEGEINSQSEAHKIMGDIANIKSYSEDFYILNFDDGSLLEYYEGQWDVGY